MKPLVALVLVALLVVGCEAWESDPFRGGREPTAVEFNALAREVGCPHLANAVTGERLFPLLFDLLRCMGRNRDTATSAEPLVVNPTGTTRPTIDAVTGAVVVPFPPGTCFRLLTGELEPWETPTIVRLLEFGRRAYRARYWLPTQREWGSMDLSVDPADGNWRQIACPR